MERYLDIDGDSSILAYEIGETYIKVQFDRTYKIYTYSYYSAGASRVEEMKQLAERGNGLNAYIKLYANTLYEQ